MRSCGLRSGSDGVVTVSRQAVRSTVWAEGVVRGVVLAAAVVGDHCRDNALFVVDSGHYGL